ncbi:radical SAM protein [Actinoplanes sp. NPDC026619]|uniref:radical SAM protein n=1 Tax=Actinoplanes sp. NPDC026619 TaxID=3155798 RepID=UPI003411BB81
MPGMLERMTIELTTLCNLRCVHCYQEHNPGDTMAADMALKLIEIADDLGIGEIVLTGGEPMLHPQFPAIYEEARKRGFIVRIFTNGLAIPPRNWPILEQMPPHEVEITIYGTTAQVLKTVTQRNVDLSVVRDNIGRFQGLGTPVHLKYHAMTVSKDDTGPFIEMAKELGCTWAINVSIIPMRNGDRAPLQYRLDGDSVKEVERANNLDFLGKSMGEEDLRKCHLGEEIYITAQGTLQGCVIFMGVTERLEIGDVKRQMLQISAAGDQIKQVRNFNKGVCPAWLHLEGTKRVGDYLRSMGADDLQNA